MVYGGMPNGEDHRISASQNYSNAKPSWDIRVPIQMETGVVTNYNGVVPDPGKGVCADPVNGGAILGNGGPNPQGGNKERQLNPDKGRDKT